ncbi:hypothetical protein IV500_04270 [Paeniglutamicibacter antarcticus]|uniref:Uncharacterized protein n=1 Tax=Arthrobacter terrae TaxID=2935737 RepID=A0A931CMI9_9MICC|nr:hypothetical protein [Arthrobacter terrae]MBG0738636.1 hypothetical protein [Arthrobacter terrae]
MLLQFCQKISSLKSDRGSINAAGALVGVVVTSLIGGVAASSAGNAIPMAHDSAAQQNAAQIATAQGLARIMDGTFIDLAGLESEGYLPPFRAAAGPRRFATQPGARGACFVVVSRSATGKHFFTTDLIPAPEPLNDDTETGCLTGNQVQTMMRSLDAAVTS